MTENMFVISNLNLHMYIQNEWREKEYHAWKLQQMCFLLFIFFHKGGIHLKKMLTTKLNKKVKHFSS